MATAGPAKGNRSAYRHAADKEKENEMRPRDVRDANDVMSLLTENCTAGGWRDQDYSITLSDNNVILMQYVPATRQTLAVHIPRAIFNQFADWYFEDQG